jgi:hypothetical protein
MRRGTAVLLWLAAIPAVARAQDVWVAHLTDPHLFEQRRPNPTLPKWVDSLHKADAWRAQERLNRLTFAAALRALGRLPAERRPRALVVSGDFGLDTNWFRPGAADIDTLAAYLARSPVNDIYIIAGNNDLHDESADSLERAVDAKVWRDVQRKLDTGKAGIQIHDVDSGPVGINGTSYRFIAVPSFSFKNEDKTYAANAPKQLAQMAQVDAMIRRATADSARIILLEHIPELDDPASLAISHSDGVPAPAFPDKAREPWSTWSAWNVPASILTHWRTTVASPAVRAILAGHFHDSHREVYRQPYAWSTPSSARADASKLFVAPPLAVKRQDTSPIQARGFELLRFGDDSVTRLLYWLQTGSDTAFDPEIQLAPRTPPGWWTRLFNNTLLLLWDLGAPSSNLIRATIWAIALLLAFMTGVAIWKVKPPDRRPNTTLDKGKDATPAKSDDNSVLNSNFGRAVIAGVVGASAITLVDDQFWSSASRGTDFSAKAYYVVMFVAFFGSLLLISSLIRGFTEAIRARITIPRSRLYFTGPRNWWDSLTSYPNRFWAWVVSLQVPVLVFLDTVWKVVRGEDTLQSKAYGDELLAIQSTILSAMEQIRSSIETTVFQAIEDQTDRQAVRVGISVRSELTDDLYYVARSRASLGLPFPKDSIAFIAAEYNKVLWWEHNDNFKGEVTVKINGNYMPLPYQERSGADYQAFIVLPLPWRRGDTRRVGCIHISFRTSTDFETIFKNLPSPPTTGEDKGVLDSDSARGLLDNDSAPKGDVKVPYVGNPTVAAVLRQAVEVLGSLLCRFNEQVYKQRSALDCG